jgi:4-hydroxy-3-methylbut-2-enyl diphosphate reductase
MIDNASELRPEWLQGRKRVGVSAGASAPEVLVLEVIARLQELGAKRVTQMTGKEEGVTFPLPRGLVNTA